jgi:hypothetical protein
MLAIFVSCNNLQILHRYNPSVLVWAVLALWIMHLGAHWTMEVVCLGE